MPRGYRWLACPVTASEYEQAYRANALFDAHRDDPEFGYRFLVDEARAAGERMAQRTAWRICSQQGWWSAFGKKRGKNGKKPGPPVHDDLCVVTDDKGRQRHECTAERPNALWLTDITEHRTGEGTLYLCAIKDAYSNRIVGYSIDSRMKSRLAVAALDNAVTRRHPRRAPDRDRDLDRKVLPPPQTAGRSRPVNPHRVRDHHDHASHPGCVTQPVTCPWSGPLPAFVQIVCGVLPQ